MADSQTLVSLLFVLSRKKLMVMCHLLLQKLHVVFFRKSRGLQLFFLSPHIYPDLFIAVCHPTNLYL